MLPNERKVKLFRDVDEYIPEKFKNKLKLVEEIIEVNDETLEKVFSEIEESVEKSQESMNFIHEVIRLGYEIRFHQMNTFISLLTLLEKKHGDEKTTTIIKKGKKFIKKITDSIYEANLAFMIDDDVDTFIKKCLEPTFDTYTKMKVWLFETSDRVPYLHIIAYLGAVKCFKYAILNDKFSLKDVELYAVVGGNMEIISILEQKGLSFAKYLPVSIEFHRYDISDRILIHGGCEGSSLCKSLENYNYRAFFFATLNGIVRNDDMSFAAKNGYLDIIKYIIEECHASIKACPKLGLTTLHHACENGHLDIVKYLVEEFKVNVEEKDKHGMTPLHLATQYGHLNVVKYLVEECHFDVEAKDEHGRTPLHVASTNGYLDIVKYLIEECHVNLEAKSKMEATPLYYACGSKNLDIVKYLIEQCHASLEAKDINGRTPFQYAAQYGSFDIFKYLVEECGMKIEFIESK